MATINNPISLPSLNPKPLLAKPFCITSPTYPRLHTATTWLLPRPLLVKCSGNSLPEKESSSSLKDALSGMVDKQVEELFNRDENKVLFDGLEKASQRVEKAKRELAEIERQELEAKQLRDYINQLETKASEIAECQQEILEAKAKVEEAEKSLSLSGDDALGREGINRDEERLESIKAASVSALVGTLAGLPFSFSQVTGIAQLILPSATTFISCALFGVTFRYAVRRDLDNFQLKSGTCAAFGFVKGLATLAGGPPLELNPGSLLSHASDGAVYLSENFLIFAFAAVSLDFCFKMRFLSPFPIRRAD